MATQSAPKSLMSLRMRASSAALAALMLWPAVHFALVERYDIVPWKFFGFAMYAVSEPGMTIREPMAATPGERRAL